MIRIGDIIFLNEDSNVSEYLIDAPIVVTKVLENEVYGMLIKGDIIRRVHLNKPNMQVKKVVRYD